MGNFRKSIYSGPDGTPYVDLSASDDPNAVSPSPGGGGGGGNTGAGEIARWVISQGLYLDQASGETQAYIFLDELDGSANGLNGPTPDWIELVESPDFEGQYDRTKLDPGTYIFYTSMSYISPVGCSNVMLRPNWTGSFVTRFYRETLSATGKFTNIYGGVDTGDGSSLTSGEYRAEWLISIPKDNEFAQTVKLQVAASFDPDGHVEIGGVKCSILKIG